METWSENELFCLQMIRKRIGQALTCCSELYSLNGKDPGTESFQKLEAMENQEVLFVVRMAQAHKWSMELSKLRKGLQHSETRKQLDRFRKAINPVVRLRDFHAHEEKYLLGRGRHRSDFEMESALPWLIGGASGLSRISFANTTFKTDAGNVAIENLVLLAGRLDPRKVLADIQPVLGELMKPLQALEQKADQENKQQGEANNV